MQITSALTQNKMDPINGNLTSTAPVEPLSLTAAERESCRT